MRVTNHDIPNLPGYELDYTNASSLWMWYGARAINGAAAPWLIAPVGSLYWSVVNSIARMYVKVENTGASTDWETFLASDSNAFVTNDLADGNSNDTAYFKNLIVTGYLQANYLLARDTWVGNEELISGAKRR